MAIARDWLKTLWRTSYKGAAFWVETDTESGARRIVIHEFPMRDDPYLEDLGERYREFTVTAYVASNSADAEASALMAVCAVRGPGILVLPTQGPVLVRCLEFARAHKLDKLGHIAHTLKFVREGFGGSLATVASLLNMIFVQAEAASLSAAVDFATTALIKDVPDYVQKAAQESTEGALATLEAVRTSVNVDPVVSAKQRDVIEAAFKTLPIVMQAEANTVPPLNSELPPSLQTSDEVADNVPVIEVTLVGIGKSVVSVASELAQNMEPATALAVMTNVLDVTPVTTAEKPSSLSTWRKSVATNTQAGNTLLRLAALIAYCQAVGKVKLSDRPSAITLRANVSNFFEEQLEALPSEAYELYYAMIKLRDATVSYLSRAIIDLAPVVRVKASLSMPSLFWAWRLYADPNRSAELVARNRVEHPSFMPVNFEALGK